MLCQSVNKREGILYVAVLLCTKRCFFLLCFRTKRFTQVIQPSALSHQRLDGFTVQRSMAGIIGECAIRLFQIIRCEGAIRHGLHKLTQKVHIGGEDLRGG